MDGYKERIALQIQREAARRGEDPIDIAHALKAHTSTVERWFRAERLPQKRHRRELAEHWGLALDVFEFDLEAEEEAVREQLNRIEAKLDLLLDQAGLELPEGDDDSIDDVADEALNDVDGDLREGEPAPPASRVAGS